MPRIDFLAEAEHCASCGAEMRVVKTRTRTVTTLAHGTFEARELLKRCAHPTTPCHNAGSRALATLVRQRQRTGYDLIVHVGLARYLRGQQREEIRAELRERCAIELSSGTVSVLCDRFVRLLEALHRAQAPPLRRALHGGYPLHLDATCERGRGGLLVSLDGWRGWVLLAARIPTEHRAHLQPLVEETVALFGEPIAVMRDLSDAGAGAVAPLRERGIPDLVCHYHFLSAVGKALLNRPYELLRKVLRATHVRRSLRDVSNELRRYRASSAYGGRFGDGAVREDLLAFILWLLDGLGKKDPPFPFALPLLDFVQRCHHATVHVEDWVPLPWSRAERRALRHLQGLLGRVRREPRIATACARLDTAWQAFDELRTVLRLSNAELPGGDLTPRQIPLPALEKLRLREIQVAFQDYCAELHSRVDTDAPSSPTHPCPHATIAKYLRRYGERLFGHPARYDDNGNVLAIVERTNNVLEQFFAHSKQRLRRRLGRAHLGRDLEHQPPQAALAANLACPH